MIVHWEDRIKQMDTTKGVSNKMIQTAMRSEIKDLRKALWWAERRLAEARSDKKLAEARASRDAWRKIATKYQKELAEERRKTWTRN